MASSDEQTRLQTFARDWGFLERRAVDLIEQTAILIQRMLAREHAYDRPATRKVDLRSALKHIDGFNRALRRVDPRSVVSMFGTLEGPPAVEMQYAPVDAEDDWPGRKTITVGLTAIRLVEHEAFFDRLERLKQALMSLVAGEKPNRAGAPATSDAILFGIECLAVLWSRHRLEPISRSTNKGEFEAFVLGFFRLLQTYPFDGEVRTALRKFFSERRNSSTPPSDKQ